MKTLLSTFLFLFTYAAVAQQYSSLVINCDDGAQVKIEWFGTEADESEVEAAWEHGGQTALFTGNACYNGKPQDIAELLTSLSESDFLGDEYRIQNIVTQTTGQISYEVYDGPNGIVSSEVTIKPCAGSALK